MNSNRNNRKAFSLTEILLAVGTLSIGMVFIAGVFPVGAILSSRSSEQTIAAVVADEAFAKIKIITADPNTPILASDFTWQASESFEFRVETNYGVVLDDEFSYPSTPIGDVPLEARQYYWSAVCRQLENSPLDVLVTVFVSRKVGFGAKYWDLTGNTDGLIPRAYPVSVQSVIDDQRDPVTGAGPVIVELASGVENLINEGYTVLDGRTGKIRPVLSRVGRQLTVYAYEEIIDQPTRFWVIPPPAAGGRYPCIGVYQKVMRF
jgi:hypothetical protein